MSSLITYGVLSHGRNGDTETGHVRITGDKYTTIMAWISANIPGSVDLVPLDVNVSPTTYDRGDPISSFNFLLHNYSSATWSGSVTVRIYLSTNDIISTSDTQLSSLTHTGSLAGRESVRINVVPPIGRIPGTLCPASNEYWLGGVVDINDANTGNNDSSTWDAAQIWINSCDAYEPDDTWGQASRIYNGISQSHGIIPAADVDWARFTLYESSRVTLETWGSGGDTRIWLYDSGLSQIDFDDDDGEGYFSWMELTLPAGTYYVKIDEYNNNDKITSYQLSFTAQPNYGVYLPLVQRE